MYKKLLNWVIRKMRRQYYINKFNECRNNSKKTWNNINNI